MVKIRLHTSNGGDEGSIPGQGIKIPHAAWCGQKRKNKMGKLTDFCSSHVMLLIIKSKQIFRTSLVAQWLRIHLPDWD